MIKEHLISFSKLLLIFTIAFNVSCGNTELFDGDFGIQSDAKPEFVIPVAYGSLSLWDVLDSEDNDYIINDADTLVFVYQDPAILEEMSVDEFFEVENLDITIKTLPITLPDMNIVLPADVEASGVWASTKIEFTEGVELQELDFVADFKVNIPATDFDYNLVLSVDELYTSDNQKFKRVVNGKAGEAYFENTSIEFDARFVDEPIFHISYNISVPAGEVITGTVDLEISLNNMDYVFAVGNFGSEIAATVDEGEFSLGDIEFLDDIQGNFSFLEPQVTLNLRNKGVGVPFEADMYMSASNKSGESVLLKLNDNEKFIIEGNSNNDLIENTYFTFSNSNSNIVDFISLPPTGDITYGGSLKVVDGNGERKDTIWHDASVGLGVDVRIPFIVDADGMNYSDTITDLSLGDIDILESGILSLILENEIPLNLMVNALRFINAQGKELANITPSDNSQVAAGSNNGAGKSTIKFDLDSSDIEALCDTEAIGLDISLSTNGEAVVLASQELSFKIVVSAKANLSDIIE